MATKRKSDTSALAEWFCAEYLGCEFDYKYAPHRKHLAAAKALLRNFSLKDIKDCLAALASGDFEDWTRWTTKAKMKIEPQSLYAITWGHPPYIERWLKGECIPDIPPIYEQASFIEWVRKYGKRAYDTGKWCGVIYAPYPSDDELIQALGPELAKATIIVRQMPVSEHKGVHP